MNALPSRQFAGIPIRIATRQQAARWICETALVDHAQAVDIHLVNAYTVALADRNLPYRALLSTAGANFPDGKPLEWLTRWSSQPLCQVRGPDLFSLVLDLGREYDLRHYLLGTTEETLELLKNQLTRLYPGVQIVGTQSPPFRPLTSEEQGRQDESIRRSGAHVTWVGLGTPKQDFEGTRLAYALPGVAIAIGAAFDFAAGVQPEAPRWMSTMGLEWCFRLFSEPRRLWRRYLVGNVIFLYAVMRGLDSR